jgi:2'-5' RNA ligase
MSNNIPQSALGIPVPEAEPWVKDLRERYDPTAAVGVPAHITVLFPFISPDLLTDSDLARAAEIFRRFRSFEFRLEQVARFPESLYLVPEPDEPFISLTEATVREFPEYPPYGGKFTEIIPHLTVANRSAELSAIAETELLRIMKDLGPIHAVCNVVELYENSSGYWRWKQSFPLQGGA